MDDKKQKKKFFENLGMHVTLHPSKSQETIAQSHMVWDWERARDY